MTPFFWNVEKKKIKYFTLQEDIYSSVSQFWLTNKTENEKPKGSMK